MTAATPRTSPPQQWASGGWTIRRAFIRRGGARPRQHEPVDHRRDLVGDANSDGIVNSDDYGFWSNTMNSNPQTYLYGGTKPQWVDGDLFYEGQVGMDDYWQMDATMTTPGSNYNLGFYPQLSPNGFANPLTDRPRRTSRWAIGPSRSRKHGLAAVGDCFLGFCRRPGKAIASRRLHLLCDRFRRRTSARARRHH